MEEFCSDIINNICLNHEHDIVKDITEGLGLSVNRFVNDMTLRYPDFNVKRVTPCGSMAEKTRIKGSEGLEYDYIVEMESWPNCGTLRYRPSCEGSMQPLYTVRNEDNVSLKTCVLAVFWQNLCKTIGECCREHFCPRYAISIDCVHYQRGHFLPNKDTAAVGCRKCSVYMTTGCLRFDTFNSKFLFIWIPKCRETYSSVVDASRVPPFRDNCNRNCIIYVDIHPVLIVTPEQVLQSYSEKEISSELSNFFYLFPKNVTNHSDCCDGGSACWRISHYNTELQLLQQTSQLHRHMFMILKYIREELFNNIKLPYLLRVGSYEVKSAVLHHINTCDMVEPDVEKCLKNTIKHLSICFMQNKLTHIVSGVNILNLKVSAAWLDNQVKGLVFRGINELLNTGIDTGTGELLKDFKLISGEVTTAIWKSVDHDTEYGHQRWNPNKAKTSLSAQITACHEALKKYVDERTRKTATTMLYKYVMKEFRYKRLTQNHNLNLYSDEKMKAKIKEEMAHLSCCEIDLRDEVRREYHKTKLLKGCYI